MTEINSMANLRDWLEAHPQITPLEAMQAFAFMMAEYDRVATAAKEVGLRMKAIGEFGQEGIIGKVYAEAAWASDALLGALGLVAVKVEAPGDMLIQEIDPDGKYLLFFREPRPKAEMEQIAEGITEWFRDPRMPLGVLSGDLVLYRIGHVTETEGEAESQDS